MIQRQHDAELAGLLNSIEHERFHMVGAVNVARAELAEMTRWRDEAVREATEREQERNKAIVERDAAVDAWGATLARETQALADRDTITTRFGREETRWIRDRKDLETERRELEGQRDDAVADLERATERIAELESAADEAKHSAWERGERDVTEDRDG